MTVVRKHERRPVSRYGEAKSMFYGYSYESLAPDKANRLMEPFIITLVPTDVEEFSTHAGQEFLYVLQGEIKVQVGDRADFLKPGEMPPITTLINSTSSGVCWYHPSQGTGRSFCGVSV